MLTVILWSTDRDFNYAYQEASKQIEEQLKSNTRFSILGVATSLPQFIGLVDSYHPHIAIIDARTIQLLDNKMMASLSRKIWDAYTTGNPAMITRIIKLPGMVGKYDELAQHENYGVRVVAMPSFNIEKAQGQLLDLIGEYASALNDLRSGIITRAFEPSAQVFSSAAWRKMVITVWSIKGGVGKSTIAKEIATTLAVYGGRRVLIIDADMNCGSMHSMLPRREDVSYNIYTMAKTFTDNNNTLHQQVVQQHIRQVSYDGTHQTIDVIFGLTNGMQSGTNPGLIGATGVDFMTSLINITKNLNYDFVICDIGQKIAEGVHMAALKQADIVFAIVTPDIAAAVDMSMTLPQMRKSVQAYGNIDGRFNLIFNSWSDDYGISRKQIIEYIKLPEMGCIPPETSGEIILLNNRHSSFVLKNPNHPFTLAIKDIVGKIYPPLAQAQSTESRALGGLRKFLSRN